MKLILENFNTSCVV